MRTQSASALPKKSRGIWAASIIGIILVLLGGAMLRFERTIPASGEIYRAHEIYVYSPIDSTVVRIQKKDGEKADPTDLLMELDVWEWQKDLLDKEREITEARSQLENKQLESEAFDRFPAPTGHALAGQRQTILSEIRELHEDIRQRYAQLDGDEARPSLEQARARIDRLHTGMGLLEAETLAEQESNGWSEFQRKRLVKETEQLQSRIGSLAAEKKLLEQRIERSAIRSPIEGQLTWVGVRHAGQQVHKGDLLAKISHPDDPDEVRAWVGERNLDLLRPGTPVRMKSHVFDSTFQGYIHGKVLQISVEPDPHPPAYLPANEPVYEVRIAVENSPFPLVLGSRVKVKFLMGRQNLFQMLLNQSAPDREPST